VAQIALQPEQHFARRWHIALRDDAKSEFGRKPAGFAGDCDTFIDEVGSGRKRLREHGGERRSIERGQDLGEGVAEKRAAGARIDQRYAGLGEAAPTSSLGRFSQCSDPFSV
jgi:hypothetical protein